MIRLSVSFEGMEKLHELAAQAPVETAKQLTKTIEKAIRTIESRAKKETKSFKRQTGNLRQKITSRMITKFSGEIVSDAPYSGYVHDGTSPTAGRFVPGLGSDGKGRRLINPRRGIHPGQKANPFMERAIEASIETIDGFFDDAVEKITQSV